LRVQNSGYAGDELPLRIGSTKAHLAMTADRKAALSAPIKLPGVEGLARTAKWLWNSRISCRVGLARTRSGAAPEKLAVFAERRQKPAKA
jgi:hypothetical protein